MRVSLIAMLLLSACSSAPLYQREYSCEIKEPVEYCSNFTATIALRTDPDAQRVMVHCLDFYREAVRSTKLLCSYFGELDQLTVTDTGQESAVVSALGKRLHRKYAERAERFSRELERVYTIAGGRGSQGAIEELSYDGRQSLEGELACEDSEGSRAPGLELLGLAAQTRRDQKETFERIQAELSVLSGVTSLSPERPYIALRTAMGFDTHRASYQHVSEQIVAGRLDEPALLKLGKAEVPQSPALERYYAFSLMRLEAPQGSPAAIPPERVGRSLASVRCPR